MTGMYGISYLVAGSFLSLSSYLYFQNKKKGLGVGHLLRLPYTSNGFLLYCYNTQLSRIPFNNSLVKGRVGYLVLQDRSVSNYAMGHGDTTMLAPRTPLVPPFRGGLCVCSLRSHYFTGP